MTTPRTLSTVEDLQHLLSLLDPKSPLAFSIWVRSPGKNTPRKLGHAGQLGIKMAEEVAAKVRALIVEGQNFSNTAVAVGVHRATVSRYIKAELKANRMAKLASGKYAISRGAYPLPDPKPVGVKP